MDGEAATDISALDDPSDVGPRVAALRRDRGLSLSELARRAGVGKATLSGLEAGTRNPTLDTLHSVAAALEVPITAVVATGSGRLRGAAVEIDVVRTYDDAEVTYELCRMRIPAGAEQTSPAHPAGVTEHATVFAGQLRAGPLDAPVLVKAGDAVEWAADVPHGYAAIGAVDVEAALTIRTPRSRTDGPRT